MKKLTYALVAATFAIVTVPPPIGATAATCAVTDGGMAACPLSCYEGIAWRVTAGFADAGPLDTVTGQVRCATYTGTVAIAGCTATRFPLGNNPCSSDFADGQQLGTAYCSLTVHNEFDGIDVTGAFAFCYDPVDPSRVLEATVTVVDG